LQHHQGTEQWVVAVLLYVMVQICQEAGLVPIVEPEVTLGPGNYSIEETAYWSERVYSHVFRMLNECE
jgi:fructose-bisphosphate aldolase class 1